MADPFDLARFVKAQEGHFEAAVAEVRAGRKRSHWMWFVFPQMRGLGTSEMAHQFGLSSLAEARAYLSHPILGPRLIAVIEALQDVKGQTAMRIFGSTDAIKLQSSLTVFSEAGGGNLFQAALERWFGGKPDQATLPIIGMTPN